MNAQPCIWFSAVLLALSAASDRSSAQTPTANRGWRYQLVEGSTFIDECSFCARPTILHPLRGTFRLVLIEQNPLVSRFELRDIAFVAGANTNYTMSGQGTYQVGGEVAVHQEMVLQTDVNGKLAVFTNAPGSIDRPWPMIDISLAQSNGTPGSTFYLELIAAPLQEIWLSTVASLTSGKTNVPTSASSGDLLSASGRIVKKHNELVGRLGIMPGVGDYGLDALDIGPGGEIFFSLNRDVFSETLGQIHHGDLLSNLGRIVQQNAELLAAFDPDAAGVDAGLDVVALKDDGEVWFSTTTNILSRKLAATIYRGDLLSNRGRIVKTNQQLLSRFHPPPTFAFQEYGLDAFYLWPSGEIWFSLEAGFDDQQLGPVRPGDLLSDQGAIVYRNLELLSAFAPLEDLADFGLDALFLVSDSTPPAAAPGLLVPDRQPQTGNIGLTWKGQGKVFQLEKAADVSGPYRPATPITPDLNFLDLGSIANSQKAFYRLGQW
jgi:hypothetical protein